MSSSSLSGSDDADVGEQIKVLPAYKPFYWLFAAVGVVLFYYSMGYAKKYSTMAAFLLPVRLYSLALVSVSYSRLDTTHADIDAHSLCIRLCVSRSVL